VIAAVALLLVTGFPEAAAAAEAANKAASPEAPALYAKALRLNPAWKEGWWALGSLEYRKDRYPQCRDAFRQMVKLDTGNSVAITMLGLCEFGVRDFDNALAHLRGGQKIGVGNAGIDTVAKYHLAMLLTRAGDFEQALGVLVTMAQSGKQSPAYLMLAGTAGLWKPHLPEDVPPDQREVVLLAGRAFWEAAQRHVPEAKAAYADLLSRYGTVPGVHYLYASFLLVEATDRAIGEFEQELKVTPDHPGALTALAAEFLRRGDAAAALPYAKRCVELMPRVAAAHVLAGRSFTETGDLDNGLRELEKARELNPEEPQVRIGLASVYAKLGRTQDAARERREFLRLNALTKRPGER
jgi:tetratricopeptide (TPR) repeat protein